MATSRLILLVLGYLQLFLHTSKAGRFIHLDARAANSMTTAAPAATPTSGLTTADNLDPKAVDIQTASITLKVAQPSRCLQSTIPYSSKFSVSLANIHVFADNTTGWGEIGSVWNFTASDDVQLNFTTNTDLQTGSVFSCQTPVECAKQQAAQPVEPTDNFLHNADGSWYAACSW